MTNKDYIDIFVDYYFTENGLNDKINIDDFNKIHDIKPIIINKKFDAIDKIIYDKNRSLSLTFDYLVKIISQSKFDEFQNILEQDKYNQNYIKIRDKEDDTLLHFAVFANNYDITQLLLTFDAKPNDYDKNKQTPIFRTVFCSDPSIIGLLCEYDANLNHKDDRGNTVLHIAVLVKNHNIITCLLEHGANTKIANNDNFYAIDYAVIKKENTLIQDQYIVDLFQKYAN